MSYIFFAGALGSVDLTWVRSRAFQGDTDCERACYVCFPASVVPTGVVSPA
jgi:hypothetical protein